MHWTNLILIPICVFGCFGAVFHFAYTGKQLVNTIFAATLFMLGVLVNAAKPPFNSVAAYVGGILLLIWIGYWLRQKLSGWIRHAAFGVMFCIAIGPLSTLTSVQIHWLMRNHQHFSYFFHSGSEIPRLWRDYLVQALFPAAVIFGWAWCVSQLVGFDIERFKHRRLLTTTALLTVILLNFHIAGIVDLGNITPREELKDWKVNYVLASRPGSARMRLIDDERFKLHLPLLHKVLQAPELTDRLIRLGADIEAVDSSGNTPLLWCLYQRERNYKTADVLLSHGADITKQGGYYRAAALHLLCNWRRFPPGHKERKKRNELIRKVFQRGADPNQVAAHYGTPLDFAMGSTNRDWSTSSYPYEEPDFELIDLLLASGTNINQSGDFGSVLHSSVSVGTVSFSKFLIDNGADVNVKASFDGDTPLHYTHYPDQTALLLEYGADLNLKNIHGRTPLEEHLHRGEAADAHDSTLPLLKRYSTVKYQPRPERLRNLQMSVWEAHDDYDRAVQKPMEDLTWLLHSKWFEKLPAFESVAVAGVFEKLDSFPLETESGEPVLTFKFGVGVSESKKSMIISPKCATRGQLSDILKEVCHLAGLKYCVLPDHVLIYENKDQPPLITEMFPTGGAFSQALQDSGVKPGENEDWHTIIQSLILWPPSPHDRLIVEPSSKGNELKITAEYRYIRRLNFIMHTLEYQKANKTPKSDPSPAQ